MIQQARSVYILSAHPTCLFTNIAASLCARAGLLQIKRVLLPLLKRVFCSPIVDLVYLLVLFF
jgi:hypothetical protein